MGDKSSEIMRYLFAGYPNDKIFLIVGWDTPQVFKNPAIRKEIAGENILYDPEEESKLRNLICVNRKKFNDLQCREEKFRMAEKGLLVSFDQIEASYTGRIDTGFNEINSIFGESFRYNDDGQVISSECGIPRGKLILIGGEQGVGKTRFYTALSYKLVCDFGLKVGVAQAEMSASEYKDLALQVLGTSAKALRNEKNFFVGGSRMRNIGDQIKAINDYRPDLWIVDSYQMIKGCNTKSGIEDMVFDMKQAINGHTAVFLVAQLNAKGEFKGDNTLQYLVDVCMMMKKEHPSNGLFSLSVPGKNRAGKSGGKAYLKHIDGQVHIIPDDLVERYMS